MKKRKQGGLYNRDMWYSSSKAQSPHCESSILTSSDKNQVIHPAKNQTAKKMELLPHGFCDKRLVLND